MTELVYEATDRMIYFLTGEKPDHASGRHYIVPRAHDTHEMTDVAKAARGKLQLVCLLILFIVAPLEFSMDKVHLKTVALFFKLT